MTGALWALVALPVVAGTVLLLAGGRAGRTAAPAAVAVALLTLGLAVTVASAHPAAGAPLLPGLPVEFSVDGVSGFLVVTVTAVTGVVLGFGAVDLRADPGRGRFLALMLLFAGGMVLTVVADTLLTLLVGWEVMGAISWALIGYWWRDPARGRAANIAFLTTRTADVGLYLAAGAALAANPTGGLTLHGLSDAAEPWRSLITGGLIAAALGKSAQLPFSFWLSRAMAGPSPVSALLHSATMVVAGAALLSRVHPLLAASGWGDDVVAWTGALTAAVLGLVAVAQTDLKQLLAASSCAQIGFMVLAAGVGATTGGTVQLAGHAAAKSLLFLIAGAWQTTLGGRTLTGLYGAARRQPAMGVLFTVGILTLAGLPPLSLWAAKNVLLAAAFEDTPALYAVGSLAAALSALYGGRVLWFVWRPAPPAERCSGHSAGGPRRTLRGALSPLTVLAVACVLLGVLTLDPPRGTVFGTPHAAPLPAPPVWEVTLSAALALVAAGAGWALGDRPVPGPPGVVGHLRGWLGLERAVHRTLVRPVDALAHAAARCDDRVLDAAVRGAGRTAVTLARWSQRRLETGVAGAVRTLAAAIRSLGRLARRPQTGQLHHYLAQAVTALTVLAVVFVWMR